MKNVSRYYLKVTHGGRSLSDTDWERVDSEHIELWKSARSVLEKRKLSKGKTEYIVTFDWTPILRRSQQLYGAMQYLTTKTHIPAEERFRKAKFPQRPAKIELRVMTAENDRHSPLAIAQSAIHDVFLIMNIAAPGCCDFGAALVIDDSDEWQLALSSIHFESALEEYLSKGWPVSRMLDLNTVVSWFDSIRQGASQVPTNPMERVLFSLLHMSKIDTSPVIVIWLFYAFESLLQTKVGENFSSIVGRLCKLLEASPEQASILKKGMRQLYDLRSALVHGGLEVVHPMHNEQLDKRVDASFGKLLDVTGFGHAVLLAAVQKVVASSWRYPRFDESIVGEPI